MKNLIIVESPAKARTISNFLGRNYKVVASKGHIRDLPKTQFGIKIEDNNFTPKYVVSKDNKDTVKELKKLAKDADVVYLATDEDREGEAIGYHVAKAIGKEPTELPRIVFHEITKSAIKKALENPRVIDMDSVDAQQARRLLDRIVGYKLSPLLASKIQRGLSAGRVQSSALKIVVDKEREIKAFKPVEYWSINALFDKKIESEIYSYQGKKISKLTISNKEFADEILKDAKSNDFAVDKIETTKKSSRTQPPFMTSTLQQASSTQLGFAPKRTMQIAQKLYEGVKTNNGVSGVITYMRTDSLNLAKEAIFSARDFIEKNFGKKYLPSKPKNYVTKSKAAQEAHEAIRPTNIEFTPQIAKEYLDSSELRLYTLIYNRFLACQMEDAQYELQNVFFKGGDTVFKAQGKKMLFDGFYKVTGYSDKDTILPKLQESQSVELSKIDAKQNFTEPPARFSEASLIKELEKRGIGRPSTYAPTITILQSRNYIEIEKKRIIPTEIAFTVIELLEKHFDEIVDANFTSNMEEKLDLVAEGKESWQKILSDFYAPFMDKIEKGKEQIKSLKKVTPIGEKCPDCDEGELVIRKGRYGEFISCSNFPKCKYSRNMKESKDGQKAEPEETNEVCDKCGSKMVIKNSRRGKFLACSAYPKCKNAKPLTPPKEAKVPCPECGGKLLERSGRRGKFFGCENYPKCKFITNNEPIGKCPECDYLMVLKELKTKTLHECLNKKCKHKIEVEK
jgi:DNA topoisomerase-1